jgi:glucose dehydrogenase
MKRRVVFLGSAVLVLVTGAPLISVRVLARMPAATGATVNWLHYGNDLANTRYQDIDQVNRGNVANLRVGWVFHTGVLDDKAELETSPIAVNGTLTSPMVTITFRVECHHRQREVVV